MRIVFDWGVSSFYGWGVYGLNLALEWARDPTIEASTSSAVATRDIVVDPLRRRLLAPFVARSARAPAVNFILLHALGNEFLPEGDARIGVIFFEQALSPAALERARRYDLIVTGSSWNERVLCELYGLPNVRTILQGVDVTLFHPAPRRALFRDRFVIFSGGKAEPRKGQDLVVKAFRIFAARHPEAMLVTAWHSPWPQWRAGMDLDLSMFADRVIDVGAVPNAQMPQILRECHIGLFPNRCEGGTNLVAMECLACGLPIIVSGNSGHLDLVDYRGVLALRHQVPHAIDGWHESDLEEIVAELETAFRLHTSLFDFNPIADLTWSRTARDLKTTVENLYGRDSSGEGDRADAGQSSADAA